MAREFNRNMFIMLISIMVGVIVITFFMADISRQSEVDELNKQHGIEVETITTEKEAAIALSENLTDNFFKSLGSLDFSREYRAKGDSYFDNAAVICYPLKQYEEMMKNCSLAIVEYELAYKEFLDSSDYFEDTKEYAPEGSKYYSIINLYIELTLSGANVCKLRYNTTNYLSQIAENLSLYGEAVNITDLLDLYNESVELYGAAAGGYIDLLGNIANEYGKFFNPNRETP